MTERDLAWLQQHLVSGRLVYETAEYLGPGELLILYRIEGDPKIAVHYKGPHDRAVGAVGAEVPGD